MKDFDFAFPENGLLAFKNGTEIGRQVSKKNRMMRKQTLFQNIWHYSAYLFQSILSHLGEARLQKFINYTLLCLSQIELPVKRGTFIEFRTGMLNISPIGRSCSRTERNEFEEYDKQHHIREKLIDDLKNKFPDLDLTYSIGKLSATRLIFNFFFAKTVF